MSRKINRTTLFATCAIAVALFVGGYLISVAFHIVAIHHSRELDMALMAVARDGDLAGAKSLIDQGANVNVFDSWTPLGAAVANDDALMVNLLLDRGADARQPGINGPLLSSVSSDQVAKLLIMHGASVNVRVNDGTGETPLTLAADRDDIKVVKVLIENGADPNLKNTAGKTAYDIAYDRAFVNNPQATEVMKFLRSSAR